MTLRERMKKSMKLRVDWHDTSVGNRPYTSFDTNPSWSAKHHAQLEGLYKRHPVLKRAFEDAVPSRLNGVVDKLLKRYFPGITFRETYEERQEFGLWEYPGMLHKLNRLLKFWGLKIKTKSRRLDDQLEVWVEMLGLK